jgi:hypothetical protein
LTIRTKILGKRMQRLRVVKKTILSRNTAVMRWRKPSRESRRRGSAGGGNVVGSIIEENSWTKIER